MTIAAMGQVPATAPASPPTSGTPKAADRPDTFNQDRYDKATRGLNKAGDAGQGVDNAISYAVSIKDTVQSLATDKKLTPLKRVAMSGKLLRNADLVRDGAADAGHGLVTADQYLASRPGTVGRDAKAVRHALREVNSRVGKPLQPVGHGIELAGAVGTLAWATFSAPSLAKDTAKSSKALVKAFKTKTDAHGKEKAVVDFTYNGAGLLYAASTLPDAFSTMATVGAPTNPLHVAGEAVTRTGAWKVADKISDVLSPVSDGLYLVGDSAYLAQIGHEDDTTRSDKIRAGVDIGLDAARLGSDCLPGNPVARTVHAVAGIVQLGADIYDAKH